MKMIRIKRIYENGYFVVLNQKKIMEGSKFNFSTKSGADSNARHGNIVDNNKSVEDLIPRYSKLFDKEILKKAYYKIKSYPGNMTPGTDKETLDGFSNEKINSIIEELRTRKFQFKPSRREYIKKSNGKLRPLGIPSPNDKIVQEAIKSILEPYFETKFKKSSHGFRPNKSCHTALADIQCWTGITWMIEGDIKGYFDNIDHHILAKLLEQEIKDKNLIDLYWKYVKVGYLEEKKKIHSINGIPQGGVLSPLLSNIYLHPLDEYMEELVEKYTEKGRVSIRTKEYASISNKYRRHRKKYENMKQEGKHSEEGFAKEQEIVFKWKKKMVGLQSCTRIRTRIYYVRYADDWVVGVTGPKLLAKEIKEKIKIFLKERLNLELNENKTKISHMIEEGAFFLGHIIKTTGAQKNLSHRIVKEGIKGKTRPSFGSVKLYAPLNKLTFKLAEKGFCKDPFKLNKNKGNIIPKRYSKWIGLEIPELYGRFESILNGIINYYKLVNNYYKLALIAYILKYSLINTIGAKLRLSTTQVFKKFGKLLKIPGTSRILKFPTSFAKNTSFKAHKVKEVFDPFDITLFGMRTLGILDHPCWICGSTEQIEMHHIKHLKRVKSVGFVQIMQALNRKQIPVCRPCHNKIHKGKYDGLALNQLKG
jgi:nicotine oxidoreductase